MLLKLIFGLLPIVLALAVDLLLILGLRKRWRRQEKDVQKSGKVVYLSGHYSPVLSWLKQKLYPEKSLAHKPRVTEYNIHVIEFESSIGEIQPAHTSNKQKAFGILYLVILVSLAVIPPWLVVQDRWLRDQRATNYFHSIGCKYDILCNSPYPSYFILSFTCLIILLLIILFFREKAHIGLSSKPVILGQESISSPISPVQLKISRVLLWIGCLGFLGVVLSRILLKSLPGLDLELVICILTIGFYLHDIPFQTIADKWIKNRKWLIPFGLMHISLILFFDNFYSSLHFNWIYLFLLLIAFVNLYRFYRQVPVILWIFTLALILFTININAWWLSGIGDEGEFSVWALAIATKQSLPYIFAHLFSHAGAYGTHPYFSSVLQAISISFLGANGFGWRFSSLYLSAISILFYYLFLKNFINRNLALMTCLFLAFSHYIMSFGKIGYNNLQAFFALSLVLWASSWALRRKNLLSFAVLGLGIGFCFYVYPAALFVIPISILCILLYYPPVTRKSLGRWAVMAAMTIVLIFPLLLQPPYWKAKIPGTFFYSETLTHSSQKLAENIRTNLTYASFSFLYTPQEDHFVAVSYLDPFTGMFVIIGLVYLLRFARHQRFIAFWILGFGIMLLLAGTTHGRQFPPATRMFLILPWLASFAAFGLWWLIEQIKRFGGNKVIGRILLGILFTSVLILNIYQAYPLARDRMSGFQSLETLFFRLVQRAQIVYPDSPKTYIFITDPTWSSSAIHKLPEYYPVQAQFAEVIVTEQTLPATSGKLLTNRDAFIIIKPWLEESWKKAIEQQLRDLGKLPCDIQTTTGDTRFQLWHTPEMNELCQ